MGAGQQNEPVLAGPSAMQKSNLSSISYPPLGIDRDSDADE